MYMTTIVYCNNIIAADSQETAGDIIVNCKCNKLTKYKGILFACSGAASDEKELINAYNGKEYNKEVDIYAIVDDHGTVYLAGIDSKEGFWKQDITGQNYAIGSGKSFAYTAMDLGCNAKEAVRMAIKRDVNSGGRIRIHKVCIKFNTNKSSSLWRVVFGKFEGTPLSPRPPQNTAIHCQTSSHLYI